MIGTLLLSLLTGILPIKNVGADEVVSHELGKHGDEYYYKGGNWGHYGNHGMRCGIGYDEYIEYIVDLEENCIIEGSLEIGVEFCSWGVWGVGGPDLYCYNYESMSWMRIKQSMGDQDELVWKWYTLENSNEWITSLGSVYFKVRSSWWDDVVVDDVGVKWETYELFPESPSNLNAYNSTSDSIQLSWTMGNGSDKTIIRRGTDEYPSSYNDGIEVYCNTGTTFIDDDLNPGEKYYYAAWAVNSQVGADHLYSEGSSNDFEYTKPGKPNDFNLFDITATSINLSWDKGIGSNKTIVRRQIGDYPESYSDGFNVYFGHETSTIDTDLNPGTKYYYRIWAFDNESGYYSLDYEQANFTTIMFPEVQTNNVTDFGDDYCRLIGTLISDGGEDCQIRFKIRKGDNGSWWYSSFLNESYKTGDPFHKTIWDLDGSTKYYYRAGARNCAGERWGDICNFTTEPGPPIIDHIRSYYADGSSASNNNGFLLEDINLNNIYTAFIVGDDADEVKFFYDFSGLENDYEYIDDDGSDGWTSSISFQDLHPDAQLNVSANNTYGWGKIKTYKPKIIPMNPWLNLYFSCTSFFSNTNYATFYIEEISDQPSEYDNYYLIYALADFSTGCPESEYESPVDVGVPGGVPDHFGGNYSYSGGIGSSILLCSNGTIDVYGGFEAFVKVKNLLSGGIAANVYGDLNITDKINWNSMAINVNGYIRFPIFHVPLILCGIPAHAGVDISPHVNVTFHLEPTNNSEEGIIPGLGIKIKEDEGISGDVGCSIIAYMEANILIAELYVEAGGDGTLYFKTPPEEDHGFFNDFLLEAWIGGRVRVLYWEAETWYNYSWRWSDQQKPMFFGKNDSSNETTWKPLNRSYIHPEQGEYNHFAWEDGSSNGAIIENAFPYAEPCMAVNMDQKSDNGVMIVWSHDNDNQPSVKGMEIRYTRAYSDGFVEPPQTIPGTYNDNRLQMDPQIIYDKNGNIICVFVQTDSSISNESSMDDVFNSTEISYCIWDGNLGTWSSIENLTDNNHMDVQPKLSSNADGDVVLVWTSDYDGDYQTMYDGNIFASFWNGTQWSNILTIAENFSIASTPDVALNDEGMAICVFSGDDDKNILTIYDQNIFYTMFDHNTTGEIKQFTFDYDNRDTRPSALYGLDGKPYIVWLKNMYTYVNDTKIDDATIFYKAVSSTKAERVKIINGTVSCPFVFQSPSQNKNTLGDDKDAIDFAVCWKSGSVSEKLSFSRVNINADSNKDLNSPFDDTNETETDLINSSDKKLSDLYCCFTADGGIAVVATERETLKNGSKHCDLSFLYSAPDNFPPYTPNNPSPANLGMDIENYVNLSWNGGDPDSDDIVYYDVYFSNTTQPIKVVQNITSTYYNIGFVDYSTEYYWKIVAHDNHNFSSVGPIWLFTTENSPPSANAGGPYSGYVNNKVTFDGSGSFDLDGNITGYQWDFDGDGIYETDWLTDSTTTFTYSATGNYNVILQVKDNNDVKDIDITTSQITKKDDNNNNGNGGGGGTIVGPINTNPVADASAGEPYQGFVGEEITFDGSLSYDPDDEGYIVSWYWDFGDGTNGTGETTTHRYYYAGTYTTTLTVTDNEDAENTCETTVLISQPNRPPSKPSINGPPTGNKNTEYIYTAISTDPDNDTIKYSFIWGDQTSHVTESEFLPSGSVFTANHIWTVAGKYTITVTTTDNKTISETSKLTVLIDVINVEDIGYFIDINGDGTYDSFHNDTSNQNSDVDYDDGKYLIDDNGDGEWDFTYNMEEGLKSYEKEETPIPGFGLIIVACALAIVIFWKRKRK